MTLSLLLWLAIGLAAVGVAVWVDRRARQGAIATTKLKELERQTRADNELLDSAAEPIPVGPARVARKRERLRALAKRRARRRKVPRT